MKNVTVIGTGYVGLATGACLAEIGHLVTCLDIDREKIEWLKKGEIPFYEPGLKEQVWRGMTSGRLQFTDRYDEAIPGSEVCFLALPTPSQTDESCDVNYVLDAACTAAEFFEDYVVLVTKSTVPVGTAEYLRQAVQETLEKKGKEIPFDVVSNPEFLREGTAVEDCLQPDRILLGVNSPKAELVMRELYAPYLNRIIVMDIPSAELSKYAANAMLASRISLMNDLAGLCEKLGANIESIRIAMGADERIGSQYLNAGLGFGGSCLPKDVKALRSIAKKHGHSSLFLDSILHINERQREEFFHKIIDYFETLSNKTLAIWGLSFKPDTDDLREAPSLYLIQKLLEVKATLQIYDPVAMPKAQKLFPQTPQIQFCESAYQAAEGSDGLILITEWEQFKEVDFERIESIMRHKVIFDGRNQFDEEEMQERGFQYFCVGKSALHSLASVT